MAETKVLTNPNLLNIILSFAGVEIKKECNICGRIIEYQILNQQIKYTYKSYIRFGSCKKIYFCNDECLYLYKQEIDNEIFFIISILICIILVAIICLVILFESTETLTININLSV